MIEAKQKTETVEFDHDELNLHELTHDGEDILTSVRIRLNGEEVLIFINNYEQKLHCKRIPYTEFREKLTKLIDDPKTGKPI